MVVTNVIEGTTTALTAFLKDTAGIMKLILQVKGQPIPVSNYARTQEDYTNALQHAGLHIECCEQYEPKILRFAKEPPGITLSHVVLTAKKVV